MQAPRWQTLSRKSGTAAPSTLSHAPLANPNAGHQQNLLGESRDKCKASKRRYEGETGSPLQHLLIHSAIRGTETELSIQRLAPTFARLSLSFQVQEQQVNLRFVLKTKHDKLLNQSDVANEDREMQSSVKCLYFY